MPSPLNLPTIGSTNWGTLVNGNWSALNGFLTGNGTNLIINGDFLISQRSNVGYVGYTSGYSADRWKFNNGGSGVEIQQNYTASLPPNNSLNAWLGYVYSSTSTFIQMGQQIEFNDFYLFRGMTLTLSFWAKANANTSASKALVARYRVNSSTINGTTIFSAANTDSAITLSTSWQYFSVQVTIPTSALGFSVEFAMTGSLSVNDGFAISQVQLEPGSVPSPFHNEPFAITTLKCERFYEKSYDLTTSPGTITESGSIRSCAYNTLYLCETSLKYRVKKFIACNAVIYSSNWPFPGYIWNPVNSNNLAVNIANFGQSGGLIYSSTGLFTAGNWMEYHYTADCDF